MNRRGENTDRYLWGDSGYENLRATDGTDISSRAKHKEYMKMNGYTTIDDFPQTWKREQEQREAYRTHGKGGAVTKADIHQAVQMLEQQRRRR